MATCKYCHSDVPDSAKFCGQCGRTISELADVSTKKSEGSSVDLENKNITIPLGTSITMTATESREHQLLFDQDLPTISRSTDQDLPTISNSIDQDLPTIFNGSDRGKDTPPLGLPTPSFSSFNTVPIVGNLPVADAPSDQDRPQVLLDFPGQIQYPVYPSYDPAKYSPHGVSHQLQMPHELHEELDVQTVHGVQQQPQMVHGVQQQPQVVHGVQQQPQIVHGVQQQPQMVHGVHHQSAVVQGVRHQVHATAHASKAQQGWRLSFLNTAVATAAVVATVAITILAVHFFGAGSPPALTIGGSPLPGQSITFHGSNFTPGSTVGVTLDNQPLAGGSGNAAASVSRNASASLLQLLMQQYALLGTPVTITSDGTFTLTIHVDPQWNVGSIHTLRVYGQDGQLIKSMNFTVAQPFTGLKSCAPDTTLARISLGPVPEGQSQAVSTPFMLCTQGLGGVNWTASWDHNQAPWLQIDSSGQIQAPGSQQIKVSASANGLKPGTYSAVVIFSNAQTETHLQVTFTVQPQTPQTCVKANTTALNFSSKEGQADPGPQSVTISNCGDTGDWAASATTDNGASWLSVVSSGGTINKGATQDVTIRASSANLLAGTYQGHVTFSIGSNIVVINVTLTVAPKPRPICINLNTKALDFTATQGQDNPGAQSVTLSNPCDPGSWSASSDAEWLSVNPANGSLDTNGKANVSIKVASNDLPNATLTFTSAVLLAEIDPL